MDPLSYTSSTPYTPLSNETSSSTITFSTQNSRVSSPKSSFPTPNQAALDERRKNSLTPQQLSQALQQSQGSAWYQPSQKTFTAQAQTPQSPTASSQSSPKKSLFSIMWKSLKSL